MDNDINDIKYELPNLVESINALVQILSSLEEYFNEGGFISEFLYKIFDSKLPKWSYVFKYIIEDKYDILENKIAMRYAVNLWNKMSINEQENFIKNVNECIQKYKNSLKLDSTPEADESDILNKFAFADQRKSQVPSEQNNEIEQKLYDELKKHFHDNVSISQNSVNILQNILQNDLYKNIIKEPQQSEVYRGMWVPKSFMEKALNTKNNDFPINGTSDKKFIYDPPTGRFISSWTLDKSSAEPFTHPSQLRLAEIDEDIYRIIMTAKISDNPGKFISGPDGLYKVRGFDIFEDEIEIIGLGNNIKVSRIDWELYGH